MHIHIESSKHPSVILYLKKLRSIRVRAFMEQQQPQQQHYSLHEKKLYESELPTTRVLTKQPSIDKKQNETRETSIQSCMKRMRVYRRYE